MLACVTRKWRFDEVSWAAVKAVPALLAASVVLVAVPAAPAASETPQLNGVFTAHYASGTSTWTITSRCDPAGCTAHVVSSGGWSRDALFSGERWTLYWVDRPDGMVCQDGTTVPANVTWSWDSQTLAGDIEVAHGAGCGNPPTSPGVLHEPFRLTQIG